MNVPRPDEPSPGQVERAAALLRAAHAPIVLAGHGAARAAAGPALRRFAETLGIPVATTFHGKGVFPDDHPLALGAVGFMRHDYVNFGFDRADLIVAVGYELQEFDPVRINPHGDTKIIHLHRFPAEVDAHYDVAVGLHSDIGRSLAALADAVGPRPEATAGGNRIRALLAGELARGQRDDRFPLAPARIVADTRAALRREDIVLVDTGALKMWMARLYPTYEPNTCLISNGLSTMAWTVPGAIGAKIARPDCRVLVATGDGAFLMNSQEIETAMRLGLAVRHPDLGGRRLRADQLEDGPGNRPQRGYHVRQPGLRGLRRELRRDRLPDRLGRGTAPDAAHCAGRRHGVGDRLSCRLLRQPRAHRVPRRPRRLTVLSARSLGAHSKHVDVQRYFGRPGPVIVMTAVPV